MENENSSHNFIDNYYNDIIEMLKEKSEEEYYENLELIDKDEHSNANKPIEDLSKEGNYSLKAKDNSKNLVIIEKCEHSNDFKSIEDLSNEENDTSKKQDIIENLELIDKGGHSNVYKSKIVGSQRIVANKVLNKEKKIDKNEMKISEKLKNKNVNNIYYYFKDKKAGKINIISEYSKLGNLKNFQTKFLEKSYLSETLLCFICYQILNGLKYIHKCKIVHLDIKPQNILIDEYLNVKIIDFSVSMDYSKIKSNTIKLSIVGTSFYMAPEILNCDCILIKDLNKIDLYSLGVILFNMAFGYYPYGLEKEDVKNYQNIYEKIMKNNLEFDNDDDYYSSYFIDFLKLLLEKDIKKRISINEALNNYWIKGAQILLDEKENLFNAEKFLGYLVTDHIKKFDDYIRKDNIVENKEKKSILDDKKIIVENEEKKSSLDGIKIIVENEEKASSLDGKKNIDENEEQNSISDYKNYLIQVEEKNYENKTNKYNLYDNLENENEIYNLDNEKNLAENKSKNYLSHDNNYKREKKEKIYPISNNKNEENDFFCDVYEDDSYEKIERIFPGYNNFIDSSIGISKYKRSFGKNEENQLDSKKYIKKKYNFQSLE